MQLHRDHSRFDAAGASLILIGQATPRHAAHFRRLMEIDLSILADEDRVSYKAAGAKLATLHELIGASVLVKGVVATARDGVVQGRTIGEPAQLGGSMIVGPDGSIPWTHMSEDASDIARPSEIIDALLTTASRGTAERGVDERLRDATWRDV